MISVPFLEPEVIRKHANATLVQYQRLTGRPIEFPLNVEDLFYVCFGLETVYDTDGVLNAIDTGIIGCLWPDGHPSPFTGKDKIIAVNHTPVPSFDPTSFNPIHTVAHEGMGHYVLHFLNGINGAAFSQPRHCYLPGRKSSVEWQADFAAGELTQPASVVWWILDGAVQGNVVDVENYAKFYCEHFGVHRKIMETRLKALGYKMINTIYYH